MNHLIQQCIKNTLVIVVSIKLTLLRHIEPSGVSGARLIKEGSVVFEGKAYLNEVAGLQMKTWTDCVSG